MPEKEKSTPIPDDPEQSKRFEEVARALGANEADKLFSSALDVIVKPPDKAPRKKNSSHTD